MDKVVSLLETYALTRVAAFRTLEIGAYLFSKAPLRAQNNWC